MRNTTIAAILAAAVALATLAGCKSRPSEDSATSTSPGSRATASAVTTAYPKGSIKVGDRAVCAVCAGSGETAGPEEIRAVLDYKGKTYAFCNESEKAEFISNPAKYARGQ